MLHPLFERAVLERLGACCVVLLSSALVVHGRLTDDPGPRQAWPPSDLCSTRTRLRVADRCRPRFPSALCPTVS